MSISDIYIEQEQEELFKEQLREILPDLEFDPKAYGITCLYIDKGLKALSEKQQYVFDKVTMAIYSDTYIDCSVCGQRDLHIDDITASEDENGWPIYICNAHPLN